MTTLEKEQGQQATERLSWSVLKDAIAGSNVDITGGSLRRAILLLAIPMMLELALESVFSVADLFWVSRIGSDAVASVGLTESLLTLVFAVSSGLGVAATALVARRMGEGNKEKAATDAVQAILVALCISVLLDVPLFVLAPKLLALMGATPHLVQVGQTYARITLGTSGVILLLGLNNAIFRGAGDAAIAMRVLFVANGINLVLDPLFIYGVGPFPKLGVAGPAVATLIGRGSVVLYQVYLMLRGSGRFQIRMHQLKLDAHECWAYLRVSSGGMLQFFLEQGSWLALVRIVSLFGASALAGYTIGFRVIGLILLPSIGLSNAAGTLVGQNIGAGQQDRARSSVWQTGWLNLAFLGTISAVFILLAKQIVLLFSDGQPLNPVAVECLRFFCVGNFMFAFAAVFLQAFNGVGDTRTPSYINLVAFWVIEIPLAYWLSRSTGLKVEGIFIAVLIGHAVSVLASGFIFARGGWMKKQLEA